MKTLILSLIMSGLMIGCGSSPSSKSTDQSTNSQTSVSLGVADNDSSSLISDLGNCDDAKRSQVCFSGSMNAYYYCTAAGIWSETQIFSTTTTATPSAASGGCIGDRAPQAPAKAAAPTDQSNDWISPTSGLTWQFGHTFLPSELTIGNRDIFNADFLCPTGSMSPTQAQLEAEFSSSFVDWMGPQFLLAGIVNATYQKSYYLEVADAEGNFDLINAVQVTTITALCIKQ